MPIKSLTIKGFRGFSIEQSLQFAQPNNEPGSGLTILVGPNNGGKSTIVESLKVLSSTNLVSFSEGRRNRQAGDTVSIRIESENGKTHEVRTVDTGGSETIRIPNNSAQDYNVFVLPSRRFFKPYFAQRSDMSYRVYSRQISDLATRSSAIDTFTYRLFHARDNLKKFNKVLGKIVDPVPDWTIDQSDQGTYYLKLNSGGQYHNSDGLGEGIVSLLFIVDGLYESEPGDVIVIDEPELSLHPAYQRKLAGVLADYSKDRQIVCATHSPYFVDFQYLVEGAEVARVVKREGTSMIFQLKRKNINNLSGSLHNRNNPHMLGLDAREVFFQEERVILVEGQDDVVHYPIVLDELVVKYQFSREVAFRLKESLFGWGAGGADNIEKFTALLRDLGFNQVVAIVDNNKKGIISDLKKNYANYSFRSIPADDIRTKDKENSPEGLLDEQYKLRSKFVAQIKGMFSDINTYFYGDEN